MEDAIEALKRALPNGQFLFPGSAEYDKSNGSYLASQESELKPKCIFQPRSAEEVVQFVQTIKPFTVSGNVQFAVRGGGQQPLPGCANIQDHITVDLSSITGIEVQPEKERVSIAAGERWGVVYDKLVPHGLAVTAGRSANGGIGGLALQDVLNFQVVLSTGAIVNANSQENTDLFAALRGGGNNFGIVTRYDFRTFPQGSIYGGSVWYFPPSFPSQVQHLVTELTKPDASKDTHLMLSIGFAGAMSKEPLGLNQLYYTKPVDSPQVLEPFTSVQPQIDTMNTMKIKTLSEVVAEQSASVMSNVRCVYMNITVKADAATLVSASDIYQKALEPVKDTENLVCSFTLQPYPVSLLEKSVGNSLGLSPAHGPLISVLLLSYWKNASDDAAILSMMREALAKIKEEAESRGQLVPYVYANYASADQDPITSYGVEEKKALQGVSAKYDPEGLFQKACPGGFKLFQ